MGRNPMKLRRTRMPFGFCNAVQWMVAYFNQMKASVPARRREVLALFVDDFALVGGACEVGGEERRGEMRRVRMGDEQCVSHQ